MKKYDYSLYEEDEHVTHNWEPLDFEITDDYKYVSDNIIFNFISNILTFIFCIILHFFNLFAFGFTIQNKNKLLQDQGFITISNHIHYMDCTMIALTLYPTRVYFPTLASNFKIPVIRRLIKILYAVPIPKKEEHKKRFYQSMSKVLANDKVVHMYPEGSLWPYYEKIRNFKYGAFKMAVTNNVPIQPIKFKFYDGEGIFKYKSNRCIKAAILDPIYPDASLNEDDRVRDLHDRCLKAMKEG